ncbi:uncharacterized protein LOC101462218 [Ceratitis capitata]|uniref:uncharacterized protein LOC101462218 n=1 Tax=Ceratitis capitata TaxID=7213 RepID=UPI00032A3A4D|nr:uncharacterized protein LOC101462218 [Ceratitis capitata]
MRYFWELIGYFYFNQLLTINTTNAKMTTEKEFLKWLQRKEKSFLENFKFALNAWNSAEFTLSSKYELVLEWLSTEAAVLPVNEIPYEEFTELLNMRAQPGLIEQDVKKKFIKMMICLSDKLAEEACVERTCNWARILLLLCDFELLQDLYRGDYELHAEVYSSLLIYYELYLTSFESTKMYINTTAKKTLSNATETEFFSSVISNLRDHIKRTGDMERYDKSYRLHILQPLVRVMLILRTHSICFFDELLQLERLLTNHLQDEQFVDRVINLPLYVRLLTLECAVVNRRGVESFVQHLLKYAFKELTEEVEKVEQKHNQKRSIMLTAAAYTLEIFRKHDINLNFKMELENQKPALTYLGEQLFICIQQCKQHYLREVLLVLCAALRLNPLILEQDIFQITTWMIVAEKKNNEEHTLFDEYLVSLMDMFRRLSRVEKLVFNMLKSLKEWLNKYDMDSTHEVEKNRKRKAVDGVEINAKKSKPPRVTLDDEITYIHIIFEDFHKLSADRNIDENSGLYIDFPYLHAAWPSNSVGIAFSKLITGLVSKPALVIWKSLLYSLEELIQKLQNHPENACLENNQFLLDLHAALICQYFNGCRLAEQYDKFATEVNEQLRITKEVLTKFKSLVLTQEHNDRSLSALLECVYHASNFELLLNFYQPDGLNGNQLPDAECLHTLISTEEWSSLQKRVMKLGKSQGKFLCHRLILQRMQAQSVLKSMNDKTDLKLESESTFDNSVQGEVKNLLQREPSMKWFLSQLSPKAKVNKIQQLLDETSVIAAMAEDLGSLEIIAGALCARLAQTFASTSKGSILATLKGNFDNLSQGMCAEQNTAEKELQKLVNIVQIHAQNEYNVKKLPKHDEMKKLILLCRQLPLGYLRRQSKNIIFTFLIAFYCDLNATENKNYASEVFDVIIDFLHFGQHVPIFKYFSLETILRVMPVATSWPFYEFVFSTIKSEEKGSEQFLTSLAENFESAQNSDCKLSDEQRRLLLLAIETLAALNGPSAKRMRKHFERILAIYSKYVYAYFNKHNAKEADKTPDQQAKKDKKFVEKTLAGFAPYSNALLINATNGKCNDVDKQAAMVTEDFRRICKIYIGHSMDYKNPFAIRLLQVALNHRQLLHLDQDEVEFVLSHYWQQLNADLKSTSLNEANTVKTTETTVKMIIGNKTNEDFLLTLQSLATNLDVVQDYRNILRCLELIAKCSFSTIKGAIFNDKFKSITCNIVLRLSKNEQQQFVDKEQVLALLAAQKSLVENKMIPISMDTLDNILAFLMDINIKRFSLSEDNLTVFKQLHCAMSDLYSCLLRHRHVLLMDRVPQFMHIFKDLIQSIVWYKSDRQKDAALSSNELEDLAELAMKLEAIMQLIATHSVHVKRVAPFVLTFIISLMVANKRATTLYPKIKTHIDSVCHALIGICDHRVGRFILRCSNEAARQVYELYVKDHKKYHKFKGKV